MKKGTAGSIGDGVVFLAKHLTGKKARGTAGNDDHLDEGCIGINRVCIVKIKHRVVVIGIALVLYVIASTRKEKRRV